MEPVTVSADVSKPRQAVFEFLDVLANHEGFMDHLFVDWKYSGPQRGVGARARARQNAPASQDWTEFEVVEATGEAVSPEDIKNPKPSIQFDPKAKTAILLVNGFNGLGLHTLFSITRLFKKFYRNFVFLQIGIIDAGNFKGSEEVENLQKHIRKEMDQYVEFMRRNGYYAESVTTVGIDIVDQVSAIAPMIQQRFPNAVFFGGQLVFPQDTIFSRWLHNYIAFSVQRRFYRQGIPFVILPIQV